MSTHLEAAEQPQQSEIIYPERDGRLMADNTRQFRWIVTIHGGLDALYRDDPDVFVAGDLLWYPVEGNNLLRTTPDVMVVFGRPKGDRGSYQQWREAGIAPQVTFEILSSGNRVPEMTRKFQFYERYGVEEYYLYDPDYGELSGWLRSGARFEEIPEPIGWTSPRLGVRFEMEGNDLRILGPDGRPFATYAEVVRQREQERQEKEKEHDRAERLAAKLRELGVDPEA